MRGPRSLMFVPANRADMLTKAPSYGADALIFDVEDSVPIAEKPKARGLAREFISRYRANGNIYVRVNALQTGMLQVDLDAIAIDGLVAIRYAGLPMGVYNREIYQERLGLTEAELKELQAAGII